METTTTHSHSLGLPEKAGKRGFRHPEEVKRRIVNRVMNGESVNHVAVTEGIPAMTVGRWVKAFSNVPMGGNHPVEEKKDQEKAEIIVLKNKIRDLEKELKAKDVYVNQLKDKLIEIFLQQTSGKSLSDKFTLELDSKAKP
jgi:transposase-like protein